MKIELCCKNQDVKIVCDSIKVENGLFVISKPVLEDGLTTLKMWIPVGNVNFVNIIEK